MRINYVMIGSIYVLLIALYIYCNKTNTFNSINKILEDNTDIDLIRDTEKPSKNTTIIVSNDDFFNKSITKGELGMAESYMDGDWTTPDLEKTLTELLINQEKLEKHIFGIEYIVMGLNNYIATFLPSNTLDSVKGNIEHH